MSPSSPGSPRAAAATDAAIVACVTGAPSSAVVVREAARLAAAEGRPWFAIHVSQPSPAASASDDASVIPHLTLAEQLGATTETILATDVIAGVVDFARRCDAGLLVLGAGSGRDSLPLRLLRARPEQAVHVVSTGRPSSPPQRRVGAVAAPWRDGVVVVAAVGLATAVAELVSAQVAEADLVLIYLVAVAVAAIRVHRVWAIAAAMLAVAAFNFFFVPPVGSFAVAHLRYLVTFAVMTVAGVLVSTTATRMRDRAREERERGRRMSVLLDVTRGLTSASTPDQIADLAQRSLQELTGASVAVALWPPGVESRRGALALLDAKEGAVAQLRADPVGTRPLDTRLAPIDAGAIRAGVAVLDSGDWERNAATRQVVRAALALLGAAVERLILDERARAARLSAEIEQTRSDLLSAVSHDLRTPLGTIKGAATVLRDSWPRLGDPQREGLLSDIDVEADRLGRMLANLLDISRLQGGEVAVAGDWNAPEDVVGSALGASRALLGGREVNTRLPAEVSLVWMDPLLIEQVLVNLLDNAARHAPSGAIDVIVRTIEGGVSFEVADRGPGFEPGDPERWFGRFEKGATSPGSGLGLAIARAVVELHGGTIEVADRDGGGARVRFTLPTGGPNEMDPPTWEDAEDGTHV